MKFAEPNREGYLKLRIAQLDQKIEDIECEIAFKQEALSRLKASRDAVLDELEAHR